MPEIAPCVTFLTRKLNSDISLGRYFSPVDAQRRKTLDFHPRSARMYECPCWKLTLENRLKRGRVWWLDAHLVWVKPLHCSRRSARTSHKGRIWESEAWDRQLAPKGISFWNNVSQTALTGVLVTSFGIGQVLPAERARYLLPKGIHSEGGPTRPKVVKRVM